jgi:hypothetical protein
MRWNLTGGDEQRAPAAGFSWLELARTDEQGVERYLTLVLMVRANKGESGVHSWFALLQARQEPGGELHGARIGLSASLTHERHPISRAAFAELADELIDTASVFRERVNALLFGLAQDRYEAVIRLLLSLRKPQLSQTLDPEELSARLTEALPELDRDAVLRVSDRLDDLDRLRAEASELREVRAAVAAFARTYRDWARAALRQRGGALLEAVAGSERRREAVASVLATLAEAVGRREQLAALAERLERQRAGSQAAARELRAFEGWRAAERLEQLRRLEEQARAAAAAAAGELQRTRAEAAEHQAACERAQAALEEQELAVSSLLAAGTQRAQAADVGGHIAAVEGLVQERRDLDAVGGLLEALAVERERALGELVALAGELARAELAFGTARERFERAEADQRQRQAERAQVAERLEQVREALLAALEGWLERLTELSFDEAQADELADRFVRAGEPGAPRAAELVGERALAAEDRLRAALADLLAARRALAVEREPLAAELARLQAHEDPLPEPLPFRREQRTGRAGAPLWALVDFADSLSSAERAGLEGALEGAGLLDTWVMPDGSLLDADDAVLVAGQATDHPPQERTLAGVLVPLAGAPVEPDAVHAVLARVALTGGEPDRPAAVTLDGRFALGPLHGRHTVGQARFIGAPARAANRARRLAELAAELAELQRRDVELAGEASSLEQRLASLRAEVRALPDETPAIRAHDALERARAEERRAGERTASEQQTMATRGEERDRVRARALSHAREHELPAPEDQTAHAALREELHAYRAAARELIGAERLRREREQAADSARRQARRAAQAAASADAQRVQREREAGERAAAHREASAAEGASVEQLRARLARLEGEEARAERELGEVRAEDLRAAQEAARAQSEAEHARSAVQEAESYGGARARARAAPRRARRVGACAQRGRPRGSRPRGRLAARAHGRGAARRPPRGAGGAARICDADRRRRP